MVATNGQSKRSRGGAKAPVCFGYRTALEIHRAFTSQGDAAGATSERNRPKTTRAADTPLEAFCPHAASEVLSAEQHSGQNACCRNAGASPNSTCPSLIAARGTERQPPASAPNMARIAEAVENIERCCGTDALTRPVHILVNDPAGRRPSRLCRAHACSAALPSGAIRRLAVPSRAAGATGCPQGVLVSSPALAFVQMAALESSFVGVLQLGFELCGTYQTMRTARQARYQTQPLTSTRMLRDFVARKPSISGVRTVERALPYLVDGSASPRETKLALLLGLPKMYGGYGLGMPQMNYPVRTSPQAGRISDRALLVCDLCWPEVRLDVEYQSREMHANENSRISDSTRANALDAMGWKVVSITNVELDDRNLLDGIADTIRKTLGRRNRPDPSHYRSRQTKLRLQLGLPVRID